jgi:ABC-type nickel/cobalt efflux system permease component RcnA
MNVFNRIVVVVLLLALLAGIIYVALQPARAVQYTQTGVTAAGAFFANAEKSARWLYMGGRALLGLAAAVLICWLLWKELKPRRPKAVKIHTEGGSNATITTESVSKRLAWHIDQLADVISVTPEVTAFGRSVKVTVSVETRPEIDVPMKTDEIVGVVKEVVTDRMGLQLGKVQVRIKHAPYQEEA